MKNYRYVSQGEFYYSDDPNTVLLTTGMTECLGFVLLDKDDPVRRVVSHIDGFILRDTENAVANLKLCIEAFTPRVPKPEEFEIYLLGGQKHLRVCKALFGALEKLGLSITLHIDTNEFCQQLNKNSKEKFTAINSDLTVFSDGSGKPTFMSFSSKCFEGHTEDDLESGNGLLSANEKELYQRFIKANDNILRSSTSQAILLRNCSDLSLIEKFENYTLATANNFIFANTFSNPKDHPPTANAKVLQQKR